MTRKLKGRRRKVRLDRTLEAPGDSWPALDLELLQTARRHSLLVARLLHRKAKWEKFSDGSGE
jgi:hypothetical protein